VAKRETKDSKLIIGLVNGPSQFAAFLNSSPKSWLQHFEGDHDYTTNETTREVAFFDSDQPVTITCTVQKGRVSILSERGALLFWTGNFGQFSSRPLANAVLRDKSSLFLATWGRFRVLEMRISTLQKSDDSTPASR
jgi:hypothetical protein